MPRPARKTRNSGDGTRERIADAALALFNDRGTDAVSTRHVADSLGMSPGNLYYHYANKEEIVLALYGRIEDELGAILAPPTAEQVAFEEVLGYLDAIFGHLGRYRFFYRDLNALVRDVPGLEERYRALASRMLRRSRAIFRALVDRGWMRADEAQLDLLATNAWIVLTQWFTHRQIVGRRQAVTSADIREGMRHLVALFSPLLEPPQRRQVEHLVRPPRRAAGRVPQS